MARLGLTVLATSRGRANDSKKARKCGDLYLFFFLGYPKECELSRVLKKGPSPSFQTCLRMPGIPTKYKAAELEGVDCIDNSHNWNIFRDITHNTIYSEFGFIRLFIIVCNENCFRWRREGAEKIRLKKIGGQRLVEEVEGPSLEIHK